jgi:hypothetical protein
MKSRKRALALRSPKKYMLPTFQSFRITSNDGSGGLSAPPRPPTSSAAAAALSTPHRTTFAFRALNETKRNTDSETSKRCALYPKPQTDPANPQTRKLSPAAAALQPTCHEETHTVTTTMFSCSSHFHLHDLDTDNAHPTTVRDLTTDANEFALLLPQLPRRQSVRSNVRGEPAISVW